MITFNITYQITLVKYFSLRYLRSPKLVFSQVRSQVTGRQYLSPNLKIFSLKISKANINHLQAKKLISICLSKVAFEKIKKSSI